MQLMSLVVACLLFAQEPLVTNSSGLPVRPAEAPTAVAGDASGAGVSDSPGGATQDRPGGEAVSDSRPESVPRSNDVVPVRANERQLTPEELVAEAISLSATDAIPGQPLSLLKALSNVHGQAERLNVVHAYWRSTLALAVYGVALDESRQLADIKADTGNAAARVEETRLAAIEAQRSLADVSRLPASVPLPLPSDLPHVRAYKTRFNEIFSASAPRERLRLIDRKLPIQLRTIDARTSAVQATEDALEVLTDSYRLGKSDLESVAAAVHELARQRRAFLETVRDYNREIANYALNIVGQEITGRQLVATLIDLEKKARRTIDPNQGGAIETQRRSGVQPAEFVVPLSDDHEELLEPTPAAGQPSRIGDPLPTGGPKPATLPPRETTQHPTPPVKSGETESSRSTANRTVEDQGAENRSYARLPLVPVERTVFRIPLDGETAQYPDLVDAEPAIQAGQLVTDLFPDQGDVLDNGQLVHLRDCRGDQSVEECHRLINAYWLARLRACEYQAYADRSEHLKGLGLTAGRRASEPLGAEDLSHLLAVRRSSDADMLEAEARLLDAQYELTLAAGRPLDSDWLLPRTSPYCGRYPMKLESQPRSLVESWPIRRLAVTIPVLSGVAMARASAVVNADATRSDAVDQFATGVLPVDAAMTAIQRQNELTLEFLDTVTAYNQSIAEYVVRTSEATSADVFEGILEPAKP